MAATTNWYGLAAKHLTQGDIAWVADTVKIMLVTSAYTPNQDTHEFRSDVTSEIAASGGYTAGGVALAAKAKAYDTATNEERLTANNALWSALTPSAAFRYGIGYKARGGASSADELLFYVNFGVDQNPAGNDFLISWPVTGVVYLLAA